MQKISTPILILVMSVFSVSVSAKNIIVTTNGSTRSISQALIQSAPGDLITIRAGVYHESNLQLRKTVSLTGEQGAVIDGDGKGEILIIMCGNVVVRGLEFRGAGISNLHENAAIRIEGVSGCIVENNHFINNFFGIYCANAGSCRISGNHLLAVNSRESNSGNGIHLWKCRDMMIEQNIIEGHRDGIYFEFVKNGLIQNNISKKNLRYGLHFMFSDSCRYHRNRFSENGAGVAVMYTTRVEMTGNTFEHQWGTASYGLLLKDISDSNIRDNSFSVNTTALYMEGCNRISVSKNTFSGNGWGIKLMANSMGNIFGQNNFINNTFDVTTNSLQNFNQFQGNYWAAYKGYDLNKDGFGDVPYRPVKLFSLLIERQSASILLLRSLFVDFIDLAENVVPTLTPEALKDVSPSMKVIR